MPCILMIERNYFFLFLAIAIVNAFSLGTILGSIVYRASLENGSRIVVPYMHNDSGQPIKWKVVYADQQQEKR